MCVVIVHRFSFSTMNRDASLFLTGGEDVLHSRQVSNINGSHEENPQKSNALSSNYVCLDIPESSS